MGFFKNKHIYIGKKPQKNREYTINSGYLLKARFQGMQ